MINSVISTPSVIFFNNQTDLIKAVLSKSLKSFDVDGESFFHFKINNNLFTLIMSNDFFIIFLEGHFFDKNYKTSDILLKTKLNIIASLESKNVKADELALKLSNIHTPYNNISNYPTNFSTIKHKSFLSLLELFDNENTKNIIKELKEAYYNEYIVVKHSISSCIKQYLSDFDEVSKFEDFDIEEISESYIPFKIDNFLIYNTDSHLTVCKIENENFHLYYLNKDDYKNSLNDEEFESEDTIFFNFKDFKERLSDTFSIIEKFQVAFISKDKMCGDFLELFDFIKTLTSSNVYFFENFNFINQNKKLSIYEVTNIHYTLLSSSNLFWVEDSLYDPNKIINQNSDINEKLLYLEQYKNNNEFDFVLLCDNPLLTSYNNNLSDSWKDKISETLIFASKFIEKCPDSLIKLNELIEYKNENLY